MRKMISSVLQISTVSSSNSNFRNISSLNLKVCFTLVNQSFNNRYSESGTPESNLLVLPMSDYVLFPVN